MAILHNRYCRYVLTIIYILPSYSSKTCTTRQITRKWYFSKRKLLKAILQKRSFSATCGKSLIIRNTTKQSCQSAFTPAGELLIGFNNHCGTGEGPPVRQPTHPQTWGHLPRHWDYEILRVNRFVRFKFLCLSFCALQVFVFELTSSVRFFASFWNLKNTTLFSWLKWWIQYLKDHASLRKNMNKKWPSAERARCNGIWLRESNTY